ncbi:MAG: DNA methyltransferase [Chthoniobacterales bacterium]
MQTFFPHLIPRTEKELWTAKQRQSHSLQEVPYRACFKAELPQYFIERYSKKGNVVFDPFMGRGTTLLTAALAGRIPSGCDINPLCERMIIPRLNPPTQEEVRERLEILDLSWKKKIREDLLTFYHPDTLSQLHALRDYLLKREKAKTLDSVDAWIRMVALTRLTGHSSGFFSVYTLPPNQAVSIESQKKINARLKQKPEPRNIKAIITRKSKDLLKDLSSENRKVLKKIYTPELIHTGPAQDLSWIREGSLHLVVSSPPFLDEVDYVTDNWLRCWFCGIELTPDTNPHIHGKLNAWGDMMQSVLRELARVLHPKGKIAIEVGEVRKGKVLLEDTVLQAGQSAGLTPAEILINRQNFTKTSNCWGVKNQQKGTNSNRIVLFEV